MHWLSKPKCWLFLFFLPFLIFFVFNFKKSEEFGSAKWIWWDSVYNDQFVTFEKNFFFPFKTAKNVKVKITAKSAYKLYLNDEFIGLGPGPIDTRRRYYDEYDIDKFIRQGTNRIKILAYNYNHPTHFQTEQTGGVLALFSFKIGNLNFYLPTNSTFRATIDGSRIKIDLKTAGIKDYEINSGIYRETYDFTPRQAKYIKATESNAAGNDNLYKRDTPKLVFEKIKPGETKESDGSWLFDFKKIIAGYPEFSFTSSGPVTITARYLENPESSIVQEDKFILPGAGTFKQEIFGRRAGRIIKISADNNSLLKTNIEVAAVRFPAEKNGDFQSNDDLLNRIYILGEDTLRYALQDQFEDSFIHEKSQYLGDSYVNTLMGFYSLDAAALAKKALFQFASTQKKSGIIETVYPSSLSQTILSYNLLFSSFLKDYYLYTQDDKTLKKLLPTAEKIAEAFKTIRDENGLIDYEKPNNLELGTVLTGWIDHRIKGDPEINTKLSLTSLYAKTIGDLAFLFESRDHVKSQSYRKLQNELKNKLEQYLTSQKIKTIDPHSAVLLLWSRILNKDLSDRIYQVLKNKNTYFYTGYFNLFNLSVMKQFNDDSGVKNLLNSYWGEMIKRGAVSTWETFDPRSDKTFAFSQAHAWSGGPTYFLPAFVAGIQPLSPGFEEILIEPMIITSSASAKVKIPCGEIKVAWQKIAYSFNLDLEKSCPGKTEFFLPFNKSRVKSLTVNQKTVDLNFKEDKLFWESEDKKISLNVILK